MIGDDDDENYFEVEHNESSPRVFSDIARENMSIAKQEFALRTLESRKQKFLSKSKNIHGDKYDYSKVEYTNNRDRVVIICPIHGEFLEAPDKHYRHGGCPKCAWENHLERKRLDGEKNFLNKLTEKHGDKFGLSKFSYTKIGDKSVFICPEHGEFQASPKHMVSEKGDCPKCTKERFVASLQKNIDMTLLKSLYDKGLTIIQIADELGASTPFIKKKLVTIVGDVNFKKRPKEKRT